MDDIVLRAMAKWPNVPHCYGWLLLDARGYWRMRDEATQAANQPGDRLAHAALIAFINRNYAHDEQERWYFQNGPQRVYVDLEVTPYIAHLDAKQGFTLHTGETAGSIKAAWFSEEGKLFIESAGNIALVDDRDLSTCVTLLRCNGCAVSDEQLSDWFEGSTVFDLTLCVDNQTIKVGHIETKSLAHQWHFVKVPMPKLN